MRTVVLDDDPTGTQSAQGVRVLLDVDAAAFERAFREAGSVYVLTNSRALGEDEAVALARRVRDQALAAAAELGEPVRFVLRGDSTLRGHVFAESDVFGARDGVLLFVPAYPAGGRTTLDGVHRVRVGGREVPVGETEYARDPVFGFDTSDLTAYVRTVGGREAEAVPLARVRAGHLPGVLREAAPGTVVVPDVVDDDDVRRVALAVDAVDTTAGERRVVVRSAAPLAAVLAGVESTALLDPADLPAAERVLVVCGSHTDGATRQLAALAREWGEPELLPTGAALADPEGAARPVVEALRARLRHQRVVVVGTERARSTDHGTLDHGARIMEALIAVVHALADEVDVVVSKGGITSAETARVGLRGESATVLGQVLPGVSSWRVDGRDGVPRHQVIVPGNVGEPGTLSDVVDLVLRAADRRPRAQPGAVSRR